MDVTIIRADPPLAVTLGRELAAETLATLLEELGWDPDCAREMRRRDVALVCAEESDEHVRVTLWTASGERATAGGAPGEAHLQTALAQLRVRRGRPRRVEVSEVRALVAEGLTHLQIAERLGVSRTTVTMCLRGES